MAGPSDLPLVTVITPVYNRASYLEETFRSVLEQDYPNLEYIVLDDGSTDDSVEVMRRYDGRIRWESHPNMGETRTVNKGFSMARGEIIGVVNSDDPLLPGAIRALVEKLVADPELLVVYPDWVMIGPDGERIQEYKTWNYSYLEMMRHHWCVPGPAAFFRRSVVERTGGRDPAFRYVADYDFWLRAGLLGPFARVPRVLATFRTHPHSLSVSAKGRAMAAEHIRLVKKIYALPNLPPEVRRIRRQAFSSAYYQGGWAAGDNAPRTRKLYFVMAALLYSSIYLRERRDQLQVMLDTVFPHHQRQAELALVAWGEPKRALRAVAKKLRLCPK